MLPDKIQYFPLNFFFMAPANGPPDNLNFRHVKIYACRQNTIHEYLRKSIHVQLGTGIRVISI